MHTPTPWHFDGNTVIDQDGKDLATFSDRHDGLVYNTEFAVRAVNAHEELLAALRSAQSALLAIYTKRNDESVKRVLDVAQQAIAKAEGK